jgi:hypothetical protein
MPTQTPQWKPGPLDALLGAWTFEITQDGQTVMRGRAEFAPVEGGAFLLQHVTADLLPTTPDVWRQNSPFPIVTVIGTDDPSGAFSYLYAVRGHAGGGTASGEADRRRFAHRCRYRPGADGALLRLSEVAVRLDYRAHAGAGRTVGRARSSCVSRRNSSCGGSGAEAALSYRPAAPTSIVKLGCESNSSTLTRVIIGLALGKDLIVRSLGHRR